METTVQHLCNQRYKAIFSQKSRSQPEKQNCANSNSRAGCLAGPRVVQVQDSPSAFCLSWQSILHLLQFSDAGLYLPQRTCGFQQLLASKKHQQSLLAPIKKKKKKGRKLIWVNLDHICLFPNQCLQLWDQIAPICLSAYLPQSP